MIDNDFDQKVFTAMASIEGNAGTSRPPVDTIHRRLAAIRRFRLRAVGVASVLVLGLAGGAWISGALPNGNTTQVATTTDDTDESPISSDPTPSASVDEIADWTFEHNTDGIGNRPSSFAVIAVSDETTTPIAGTEIWLRVNTDGQNSELILFVGNDPCETQFAIGLIDPVAEGEFTFDNGGRPTIGIPTEFSMEEPLCEAPLPEEFFELLAGTFTLATSDGAITFTSLGSGREFTFIAT